MTEPVASPGVRLDVWLWAARFFKTRSLCKQAIGNGKIQLGGQSVGKASRLVRVGDQLSVERGNERLDLIVQAVSEQRGPASKAQTLYEETAESAQRRLAEREQRKLENAGYAAPEHRPDKRARRKLSDIKHKNDGLPPWFPR